MKSRISTVRVDSLPHSKWKETKQQPNMLPVLVVPVSISCGANYLHELYISGVKPFVVIPFGTWQWKQFTSKEKSVIETQMWKARICFLASNIAVCITSIHCIACTAATDCVSAPIILHDRLISVSTFHLSISHLTFPRGQSPTIIIGRVWC